LSLRVTNYHTMNIYCLIKHYTVTKSIAPRILNLRARCRRVVSFTLRPLYSRGKEVPIRFGQEAGLAPETVWKRWRREKSLPLPGIAPSSSHTNA